MRGLQFDPQPIRQPVHEGEIACDLTDVKDCSVREAGSPQRLHVLRRDGPRLGREPTCIGQHGPVGRRDGRSAPVHLERRDQRIVSCELTEPRPVMRHSVVAAVRRRDGDRDHLPLGPAERGASPHQRLVELEMPQ